MGNPRSPAFHWELSFQTGMSLVWSLVAPPSPLGGSTLVARNLLRHSLAPTFQGKRTCRWESLLEKFSRISCLCFHGRTKFALLVHHLSGEFRSAFPFSHCCLFCSKYITPTIIAIRFLVIILETVKISKMHRRMLRRARSISRLFSCRMRLALFGCCWRNPRGWGSWSSDEKNKRLSIKWS